LLLFCGHRGIRVSDDQLFALLIRVFAVVVVAAWLFVVAIRSSRRRRGGMYTPPSQQQQRPAPPPGQPARYLPPQPKQVIPLQPSAPARSSAPAKPQAKTLDLDVAQFTPLTDEQVKAAARAAGSSLWSPLFGRRDLIPPANDPRTNLIDRSMVAHGLITPERLQEIHHVGEQMDEVRPDMSLASQVAQQAVTEDREARKRLREQKKQEAAERKRKHAEDVARRKATDIIYLGRGVSKGLSDRRSNVEKLQSAGLPVLATPADLASALKLDIKRLRWLAYHSDAATVSHYINFTVPKKSGGVRHLSAPHEQLAAAQEWILTSILEKIPVHDAAHGFVIGRSTVTNARPHIGSSVVVNTDLTNFFPSITFWRIDGVFRQLGYSPAVSTILALLCSESPRKLVEYNGSPLHVATGPRALPQGACTSPALSNLVSRKLDARLTGIATKLGWTYTRYADDLTFSLRGTIPAAPPSVGGVVDPATASATPSTELGAAPRKENVRSSA
jgi:hypothetical protein